MKQILITIAFLSLGLLTFSTLLRPGYFPMHDDMQAMRVLQMTKCFQEGQFPCRWVPDMGYGYGYPQFNYYPPLPYYFMTALHMLDGMSIIASVKAGFVASFLLSGIGMFLLGKQFWGTKGGVLSGLFYLYAPYRANNIYSRGAMGEIWAMAWFPWLLYGLEGFTQTKKSKYLLILTLSLFGLFTSHLLSALMILPLMVVWTVWRFGVFPSLGQRGSRIFNHSSGLQLRSTIKALSMDFLKLTAAVTLAVGLAAFYVLPVRLEQAFAHLETLLMGYFNYLAHFVSLRQLFFSTHWGYGSSLQGTYEDISFSLGLWHWLVPLLSIGLGVWYGRRKPVFKHLGVLLLIGLGYLGLTHARSTPIWQQISLLEWLQFPWRFLAPASFVFALAAGSIVAWKPKLGWKPIWLIVIPLIIFNRSYHQPTDWFPMTDQIKFSGELWEKQLTISIFDYLPIAAEHPPTHKAPEQPWFVVGTGQILTYHKTASRQWGQVESTTSASLRLPLYDFPGMQARVNNQIVSIDNHNELGLITIDIPPGSSQIEAKLTDTPIRKTGNIISLLSWVILLSWLSWVHLIQPAIKRLSLNIKPPHKHQTGQH